MSEPLLPARFLFRFAVPCLYHEPVWTEEGARLEEKHRLADFAELENRVSMAEVRAGWAEAGLAFAVEVRGKQQPPWCRESRPEDSDGFQVWIDTRDVHNIHRAGRFCHRFLFLPGGGGPRRNQPLAEWLSINRAREHPRPVQPRQLAARSQRRKDGYLLEAFIAAEALTGFDPADHPRLGFTYAVIDRELGEQTFTVGSPMPYQDDPSLWGTLELVRETG